MRRIIAILAAITLVNIIQIAYAFNDKQTEINKQNVMTFYNEVINQKNYEAAEKYLGSRFTQHNPSVADGQEGLKAFIQFLKDNYKDAHSEIKKVFADGDYVILHVHSIRVPGTRGRVIFDLFRLQNGKIVEHWDTIQEIPEISANTNGMF